MTSRYPCVCCGHLTMNGPPGRYQICPVCFWEDDAEQLRWPDLAVPPNWISLIEAQKNYQNYGSCDEQSRQHVRPAQDDEPLDQGWRPIDPQRDHFEPQTVELAPWPDDRTVLYWWCSEVGFWHDN